MVVRSRRVRIGLQAAVTEGRGTDRGNAHKARPADVGQEAAVRITVVKITAVKNTASTRPGSAVLRLAGPTGSAAIPGVRAA